MRKKRSVKNRRLHVHRLTEELKRDKKFLAKYEEGLFRKRATLELEQAAQECRMTQAAIAKRSKTSQSAVSAILAGKRNITFDKFARVAASLGKVPRIILEDA